MASLFSLGTTNPPFAPALTTAPNDFTISLTFTGAGLSNPFAIAIDTQGHAWTTNTSCNCLAELSSLGAPISGPNGYTGGGLNIPEFLAFDLLGTLWINNSGSNGISAFSRAGVPLSPVGGFTDPSLNTPIGVAIDGSNDVWIPDYSSSTVSEFKNTDGLLIDYAWKAIPTTGGLSEPVGIAFDPSGHAWIPDYAVPRVTELDLNGNAVSQSGFPLPAANDVSATAVDFNGNVWLLNLGTENLSNATINAHTGSLFEMGPNGNVLSPSGGYPCGNLNYPYALAIDGDGNPWIANSGSNQIGSCGLTSMAPALRAPIATGGSPVQPCTSIWNRHRCLRQCLGSRLHRPQRHRVHRLGRPTRPVIAEQLLYTTNHYSPRP